MRIREKQINKRNTTIINDNNNNPYKKDDDVQCNVNMKRYLLESISNL